MNTQETAKLPTLAELKRTQQEALNELFKNCGLFWAFSDEQFENNKTPLQEGEKYVSIGAGGYLPKSKVLQFHTGFVEITAAFKKAVKERKELRYQHIAYQLANHEAYYTNDISDTLETLGSDYTKKEVWTVFYKEQEKHQ